VARDGIWIAIEGVGRQDRAAGMHRADNPFASQTRRWTELMAEESRRRLAEAWWRGWDDAAGGLAECEANASLH